jgi:disulfide bond formation protein DsbB
MVIAGQALLVVYFISLAGRKTWAKSFHVFASEYALLGAFLVTVFSMVGSLYLSEVAKYVPCELCWYQRALMYPQVVLLGLALAKKNRDVVMQILVLSGLGACIAIYHIYLQSGGTALVPCSTVALAVPCGVKNFQEFGYVTIPIMSLTGFVMLIIAALLHRQAEQKNLTV